MTQIPVTVEFEVHRTSEKAATAAGAAGIVIAGVILILIACRHQKRQPSETKRKV
jgi:cobalamin synthase